MNITPVSTNITANVNAAELAALKAAIASANVNGTPVIALPPGKSLDDVPMFSLRQLPNVLPNGTAAVVTGQIK